MNEQNRADPSQRILNRRYWALILLGAAACFLFQIIGILIPKRQAAPIPLWILLVLLLLPLVRALFGFLDGLRLVRQFQQMDVREMQSFLLSHREKAEAAAQEKRQLLRNTQIRADVWAAALVVLALTVSLLSGMRYSTAWAVPIWMLTSLYAAAGLTRIRFSPPETMFSEDDSYVDRADFPLLYGLAERAAEAAGCGGEIRLSLSVDNNAGVGKVGDTVIIQLGVILLSILSERELYTVLLHECAHITLNHALVEYRYFNWLDGERDERPLSTITDLFFQDTDAHYAVEYSLYRYAAEIHFETEADRAMVEHSDAQTAASALLKLKYFDLFTWETENREGFLRLEERLEWIVRGRAAEFLEALPQRMDFWNKLIQKEILANDASHPTTRARLASMGISELQLVPRMDSEAYASQIEQARSHALANLRAINEDSDYDETMQKSQELVASWERSGKPLIVEEYRDVIAALRDLGRLDETIQLCDRAIAEFPFGTPISFPCYYKGCFLLHQWDDRGIELIYRAIDGNSNYIDEGLDEIGSYCCLTGNQAELDRYREHGMTILQQKVDIYDELGVLRRSDNLSTEHLPEELQEQLLGYILSFENGNIETLYLVRKTITSEFFTSAMVVRFTTEAEMEAKQEIMHKIFSVLDNDTDWQFSLFEYDDVMKVPLNDIPGAVIYQKNPVNKL